MHGDHSMMCGVSKRISEGSACAAASHFGDRRNRSPVALRFGKRSASAPRPRTLACNAEAVWESCKGIAGIGYEGESVESFVAKLDAWRVKTLFDVRLNPMSRKRGFSKSALRAALEGHGIAYVHLAALGNPRDNREGYGELGTVPAESARQTYAQRLANDEAQEAIDRIVKAADRERVVLMCFEASTLHCHREQVLDEVTRRSAELIDV